MAQLPDYDENTTQLIIPKKGTKVIPKGYNELVLNHNYLIMFAKYIINPPDNFTLHTQWNKGIVPEHICMKIKVQQEMGKMVKVGGFGYDYDNQKDLDYFWSGWVPKSSITIIEEI